MASYQKIERSLSNSSVAHFNYRLATLRDVGGPTMGRMETT